MTCQMPKRVGEGKTQAALPARQQSESMMLVKPCHRLVLGVNQHGEHTDPCPQRAVQRIRKQDTAELLALVFTVHCKAS